MRLRVVSTAAALLAVVPGITQALGLGDIQLKSALNAPLNAEIELIATAEELASLKTQIAARDTFSRYGLDYPAFLSGIQVKPVRLADGRNVIQLTSSTAMTEPFATVLVEAIWARGRNLREYTVLFDPPVFAPEQSAAAPVAAPVGGAGERSGAVSRPAETAPVAPAPAPAAAGAAGGAGDYPVRSGDSLSAIAQRQYGSGQSERAMIAIYRANPEAFDGNINRLRAGAVLRMPDSSTLATVDASDAAGEVRRQVAAWSSSARAAGAPDARLRLVPPGGSGSEAATSSAEARQLRDRVTQLESELSESRRLLELRNTELAKLQGAAAKPAPARPVPAPPPPAPEKVAAPVQATPPQAAPAPQASAAAEPAAAEAAPKPKPPRRIVAPVEQSGPSLFERLQDFWYVPVFLLAILAGFMGMRAMRRRRAGSIDNLSPFAVNAPAGAVRGAQRDVSSNTFPLRRPAADADDPSILVEESGTHERPAFTGKDTRTVDLDDGTASMMVPSLDATAALEQGDPLAEADFHMAYGLYDQAADLVKLAVQREPSRRDLKLKLLEVFFVWGNKDQFLQTARDLADTRDASAPGEWEKVIIMGKQLAPEDALFTQSYSGAGPASVDLNLEGGQNLIDFDLQGEPSISMTSDGGVDMNLSGGQHKDDLADGEQLAGLDFVFDDPLQGDDPSRSGTTRQMAQPGFNSNEEAPTQRFEIDGPTVEQPALNIGDTLVGKLDAQTQFGGPDQTAELALDDLGLDLGKLESTNDNLMVDSRITRSLESPEAPTLVAGLDDTARRLIEGASDEHPTELLPLADFADDGSATSRVAALDLEFNLDSDAETGKRSVLPDQDFNLDLDVGTAEQPMDGEYQRTQRIDPVQVSESDLTERDLEPVTMSEVGTKLDLARAYMDMGDPDGARSILNEVLQEGSVGQRQEAQRLIDSIPG